MRRFLKWMCVCLAVPFVAIQFVRPDLTTPAVDRSRSIDARLSIPADVAAILDRSCRDCHSNETRWPWYSQIAPVSWIVANDVREGRAQMNFSDWAAYTDDEASARLMYIAFTVRAGRMPLAKYVRMHRDARLSPEDVNTLAGWAEREVALAR